MNFHEDDRAQRLFDVFSEVNGQINISHVNSTGHVVAWHKHKVQTDYWFCVKGSFKVGLAFPKDDGYEVRWEYLSDKFPRTLTIPPGVYHYNLNQQYYIICQKNMIQRMSGRFYQVILENHGRQIASDNS